MRLLSIEYEHEYNPTKCLLLNVSGRLGVAAVPPSQNMNIIAIHDELSS